MLASITVSKVENALLEQLKNDFENKPINIEISPSRVDYSSEISIVKAQIKKIETKEERVKLAYENGIDTLEEYKANKERLSNDKKMYEKKLKEIIKENNTDNVKEEIFKHCGKVYEILSDPSVSENDKYIAVHHLIDKIIYDKPNQTLVIYYK